MSIIITKASPYEFTKALLTDKNTYAKYTDTVKRSNYFMCMRMIAKKFPIQVSAVNINGIDQVAILDYFHYRLCKHGQYLPDWMRVKAGNEIIPKEEKLYKEIKKDVPVCKMLMEHLGIELKSLEELIYRDYNLIENELKKVRLSMEGKLKKNQKI